MKQTAIIHYVLILAYGIISVTGILHHELWLDESHHWLLARDSESIAQLWTNTRYEGHPLLWNGLLYGISRFSWDPMWMQLLHICISTAAVAVFVRKAPLNLVVKILFIFGYFMLFEYNLISRNYSLGVLFLFLSCMLFERRREKFIQFSICIVLLANTHLMFTVIAVAFFATAVIDDFSFGKNRMAGYVIFSIGLLIAAVQVLPPDDSHFLHNAAKVDIGEKFIKGFASVFKGIFAMPNFGNDHFWNSNVVVAFSKPVASVFALVSYGIPLLLFKNRKTLFFVYIGLLGTQVFFYVTQLGATRYDGMTYMIIIAALWIDQRFRSPVPQSGVCWAARFPVSRAILLYTILGLQFVSGIVAYVADYRLPFSGSKAAAQLVGNFTSKTEMASVSCEGTIVGPYLNKKLIFLCDQKHHSYCQWQAEKCIDWNDTDILNALSGQLQHADTVVFFKTQPLNETTTRGWNDANPKFKIFLAGQTGRSIIRYNTFYVYKIVKLPS